MGPRASIQVQILACNSIHGHSAHKDTGGQVTCIYCWGCSLIGLTGCPQGLGGAPAKRKRSADVSGLHAEAGAGHLDGRGPSASPVGGGKVSELHWLPHISVPTTESVPHPKRSPGSIFC